MSTTATANSKSSEGYDVCIEYPNFDASKITGMPATAHKFIDDKSGRENTYYTMAVKYAHPVGDRSILDDAIIICPELEAPYGIAKADFSNKKDDGKSSKSKSKSKVTFKKADKFKVGFTVNTGYQDQAAFQDKTDEIYYAGGKLVETNDVALGVGGFETPAIDAKKKPIWSALLYVKRDEKNVPVKGALRTLYCDLNISKRNATQFMDLRGHPIPWSDLIDVPFKCIPYVKLEDIYSGNGTKLRTKLYKAIVTQIQNNQPTDKDKEVIARYNAMNPAAQEVQAARLEQIRKSKEASSPITSTESNKVLIADQTTDAQIADAQTTKSRASPEPDPEEDEENQDSEDEQGSGSDTEEDPELTKAVGKMTVGSKAANSTYSKAPKVDLKALTNGDNPNRTPSTGGKINIRKPPNK